MYVKREGRGEREGRRSEGMVSREELIGVETTQLMRVLLTFKHAATTAYESCAANCSFDIYVRYSFYFILFYFIHFIFIVSSILFQSNLFISVVTDQLSVHLARSISAPISSGMCKQNTK